MKTRQGGFARPSSCPSSPARHPFRVGAIAAVTSGLLLTASCGSGGGSQASTSTKGSNGSAAPISMSVGVDGIANDAIAQEVAAAQGFFTQQGIKANIVSVQSGSTGMKALLSGDLDVSMTGGSALFGAVTPGSPSFLCVGTPIDTYPYVLAGAKGVNNASDLRGKGVAVSTIGSASDFAATAALKAIGLSRSDVVVRQTGGTTARLAAAEAGSVGAAIIGPDEYESVGKSQGLSLLVDLSAKGVAYPSSCYAMSTSFMKKYPDGQKRFMAAMVDARNFIKNPAKKDQVIAVIAKYYQLATTDPLVTGVYKYISSNNALVYPAGLKITKQAAQYALTVNNVAKQLKVSDYVSPSALAG